MFVIKNRFADFLMPRKEIWSVTLFPFIFVRRTKRINKELLIHEKIHLRQQAEMLIVPFYLWYFFEMIIRAMSCCSWTKAYHQISFEREAYANHNDSLYLENRKFWAFIKYLHNSNKN